MAATSKRKTVLLRLVRTAGATLVAFVIAWLAGPDVADVVGSTQNAVLLAAVLTPLLAAAEKALRYGGDPGETG